MKKTTTFLIILLLVISSSQAQNWRLFRGDTVHYSWQQYYDFGAFNQSNTFCSSILVDSVISRSSSSVFVFKEGFKNSEDFDRNGNCANLSSSFFGDSLEIIGDSNIFYIDPIVQVYWDQKSINWTFYSDSTNQLQINLDSVTTLGLDSLRFYSFTAFASPSHDLQQFDTAQIIVSKSKGMVQGFVFSVFPDTLIPLEMLKVGPVINRDVYNLEIGDEYHFVRSIDNFSTGIALNDKYIIKVLNKTMLSTDSVTYVLERTVSDEYSIINQGHVTKNSNSYIDTIGHTYDLNNIIGTGSFIDTTRIDSFGVAFYSDKYGLPSYVSVGAPIYELYQNQLCNNFFEHDSYTEYIFGIGSFNHILDVDMGKQEYFDENLVYYKKGNDSWGSPLNIVVGLQEKEAQNIEIYPNPVDQLLTIKGLSTGWKYELNNISGQRIKEGELSSGEAYISMDKVHPGTYLVKIYLRDKHFIKKIIVK